MGDAPARVTLGQPLPPDRATLDGLVDAMVAEGRWSNDGAVVRRLEATLAEGMGARHALAAASGTTALTLALLALELPAGSEVVTTPLTFAATTHAIEAAGLVPVFAAVDPWTLCMDADAARAAIGSRTGAILAVHLFGLAVDPRVDAVAAEAGIPVVYDAAHAYGLAAAAGRGIASACSLHATKLLHTGEGGVVTTDDDDLAARVRVARGFGLADGVVVARGTNGRMSELAAALGLAVHAGLPAEVRARERLRAAYADAVADSSRCRPHAPGVDRAHVMEVVRCPPDLQRALLRELADRGVAARRFEALCAPGSRFVDVPLVGAAREELVALADGCIALPFHGRVDEAAVDAIRDVLAA